VLNNISLLKQHCTLPSLPSHSTHPGESGQPIGTSSAEEILPPGKPREQTAVSGERFWLLAETLSVLE